MLLLAERPLVKMTGYVVKEKFLVNNEKPSKAAFLLRIL